MGWFLQRTSGGGGGGSPGGANTNVQYNNAGAFAGSANFTYDSGTNTVTFGTLAGSELDLLISPRVPTAAEDAGYMSVYSNDATKINGEGGSIGIFAGSGNGSGLSGTTTVNGGSSTLILNDLLANLIGPTNSRINIDNTSLIEIIASDSGSISLITSSGTQFQVGETVIGTPELAFFGAALTAKPAITGSRGGNAALASLLTALATQGLITDSTTA